MSMARAGERFTVHFGQELMLTTLLAANADRVTRVVCGIPVYYKGGTPE